MYRQHYDANGGYFHAVIHILGGNYLVHHDFKRFGIGSEKTDRTMWKIQYHIQCDGQMTF